MLLHGQNWRWGKTRLCVYVNINIDQVPAGYNGDGPDKSHIGYIISETYYSGNFELLRSIESNRTELNNSRLHYVGHVFINEDLMPKFSSLFTCSPFISSCFS